MSTKDVPGANPANKDTLAMGCWAEAADGSLLLVEGLENGTVIFTMFDVGQDPVVEFRDATPEVEFKTAFSFGVDRSGLKDSKLAKVPSDIKWTWHDKTPFPWSRAIKFGARSGMRYATASDQLAAADRVRDSMAKAPHAPVEPKTAASKVAESLDLKAQKLRDTSHLSDRVVKAAGGIIRRIGEKLEGLGQ
jgi:hypothetical protein